VVADAVGTDALTGCETTDFAPAPVTPAPPPAGGGGDPAAGGGAGGGGQQGADPAAGPAAGCLKALRFRVALDRRLRSASVRLAGKRLRTRRIQGRLTVIVDLRGRRAGRYRLEVKGRTKTGRRLSSTRRLRVCA
jgi:hypothetical protein